MKKKLKVINIYEKYRDMNEDPNFEQNHCSKTQNWYILKIAFGSIRLMQWLAYYDGSYY